MAIHGHCPLAESLEAKTMRDLATDSTALVTDGGKKHAQLRNELARGIASGEFAPGKFLPSEPELARQFAISRSTVRQALSSLEQDGLVERLPGKGALVREREGAPAVAQLSAFAIVLPEIQTGHYPALVDAFASSAGHRHYQILVCTTGNELSRQGDIILQLMDKRVAGVALLPPTVGSTPEYQLRQLQGQGIPIVMLHRSVEGISAPVIAMPFEDVMSRAAEVLLGLGHRNIAFLASHPSEAVTRYLAALRDELEAVGASLPKQLVHVGASSTSSIGATRTREIESALIQLLSLPDNLRPTAIIDPWDSDMEACYFALTSLGVRVPEEMSLVSFGGASRMTTLTKRLTAVTVDEPKTAELTAQLLDEMRTGSRPIADASSFAVPLSFHQGETVSVPPALPPRWKPN